MTHESPIDQLSQPLTGASVQRLYHATHWTEQGGMTILGRNIPASDPEQLRQSIAQEHCVDPRNVSVLEA